MYNCTTKLKHFTPSCYGIEPNDIKCYERKQFNSFKGYYETIQEYYLREHVEVKKEIEIEHEPDMVELRKIMDLVFS